ncbi:MAG TPA: pyridoxamine 5'-phosphate oxidase family protein [Burkholderiaceae bacterium]
MSHQITTAEALRALYPEPRERALKKQIAALDRHSMRFIELSPFVVLATSGAGGTLDASPRGGAPGFVKTPDAHTLLLPDAPGNNRLDSFSNIVESGRVGLLFLIPGFDETLRVNSAALLSTDPADIARCGDEKRAPKLVIRVRVQEVYLHCAKAFMRSKLWSASSQVARAALPTMGEMLNDQTGIQTPPETQEEMVRRYAQDL